MEGKNAESLNKLLGPLSLQTTKNPSTSISNRTSQQKNLETKNKNLGKKQTTNHNSVSTNLISNNKIPNNGETGNTLKQQSKRIPRTIYHYQPTDKGPFDVYIENSFGFEGKLNAIKIGEVILNSHSDIDKKITHIQSIENNIIKVVCNDYKSANILVKSTALEKNNLVACIPKFLIYKFGIIKEIDVEFTENYLKNRITTYDVQSKFDVVYVKRMNRRIKKSDSNGFEYKPTKTILVSFRCQTLPEIVLINKVVYNVEIYNQKLIMCNNCYRYGHLTRKCRNIKRCLKCGQNHEMEVCDKEEKICLSCRGNHLTNEFELCPEYSKQQQIKKYMSQTNCSYKEAYNSQFISQRLERQNHNSHNSDEVTILQNTSNQQNSLKRPYSPSPDPTVLAHNSLVTPLKNKQGKLNCLGSLEDNESECEEEDEEEDSEEDEQEEEGSETEHVDESDLKQTEDVIAVPSPLKVQFSVAEFIETPSASNFLALGLNRTEMVVKEAKKNEDISIEEYINIMMKVSALSDNTKPDVADSSLECAEILYKDLFSWAQKSDKLSIVNNSILVSLGLIKSEEKKYKPLWNLNGCLNVLKTIVNKNYVPESTKNTFRAFIKRDIDNGKEYIPVKKEILASLS